MIGAERNAISGRSVRFSKNHTYAAKIGNDKVKIGISDFAQKALGNVVFVDLPRVGAVTAKNAEMGAVESVKNVSDVNAPVAGEVVEVNKELENDPGLLNRDPEGRGWIAKLKLRSLDDFDTLLDRADYEKFCQTP